jgi:hypothetical protein
MADSPFRRGDRVEWVGPTDNDEMGPRHGERGWVVDMDPMDDVIAWDYSGTLSGTFRPRGFKEWRTRPTAKGSQRLLIHAALSDT